MATRRPFRATIYLPGHDETGHGVAVAKTSASSEHLLTLALQPWLDAGYHVVRYEVLSLDLGMDDELD